jgi:hypothetical protein
MAIAVVWADVWGAKVVACIHHHGTLAGRYTVSRLWPDIQPGGCSYVALWPATAYAGTRPVICLDAGGAVITEAEWLATTSPGGADDGAA